jgi:hypothetical protein
VRGRNIDDTETLLPSDRIAEINRCGCGLEWDSSECETLDGESDLPKGRLAA